MTDAVKAPPLVDEPIGAVDPETGLPPGFGKNKKAIPKDVAISEATKAAAAGASPPIPAAVGNPDIPDGCPAEIAALISYLPAGLTVNDVWNWKKRFGRIYFVEICDDLYFYRAMAKPEYKAIMALEGATREIQEEKIAELCVLYPRMSIENLRMGVAGLAPTITEYIMRASAFGAVMAPTKL